MKTYVYVTTTELEWPGPIQSSGAPSGIKVFELDDSGTLQLLHQCFENFKKRICCACKYVRPG